MAKIHRLLIQPPLLNSSSLWASSCLQLEELYGCQHTGAVTTRTATISGFNEDPTIHKHALFQKDSSINSYGYSPHPLSEYLTWIRAILTRTSASNIRKPIIISVAPGSSRELSAMMDAIQRLRHILHDTVQSGYSRIGIELNTSCPNIPGHPPPAYDPSSLVPLLDVFRCRFAQDPSLTLGLKLAPYVHIGQYQRVVKLLSSLSAESHEGEKSNCIAFLSCTNTLGSSLVFQDQIKGGAVDVHIDSPMTSHHGSPQPALPTSTGGLAGEPIHALSLGNVYTFQNLLSGHPDSSLRRIAIIGIGGVTSAEAVTRMRTAGASAVACATALGTHGVDIFSRLSKGL